MSKTVIKTITKVDPNKIVTQFSNVDKMSKKELVKAVQDFILPLSDPTKYKAMIKSAMPDLVKNLDDREVAGQAIMQSGQEFLLVILETLKQSFDFTDAQVNQLIKEVQGALTVATKVEEGGLSLLSDHSMKRIVQMIKEVGVDKMLKNIAEIRYQKETMWKAGLEHPQILEGSNIAKRLQKPGK